ncbi:3'-5' exonuclease [Streptomyces kaniharaensis]|uniref:3'-5' exonuclease n=1 Tax=Streptomyces kaniharaensis TaxID=212423 RepID=A0A6N7L255_9ACTN|nr:3'-5' exonuclease [Streptomyces kaniharaensis]MQS17932.1 3'-5' exonuclease [Streptomyces kaniharaensis]MQS17975.1 3'-5' exonuclease [Streptomyces kaniharaensis]
MERDREVAGLAAWAAALLDDPEVAVLDLETTGLGDTARIVEIGVVTTDRRVLLDRLVNPGIPMPAEATRHNGITDEMLTGRTDFDALMGDLTHALTRREVRGGGRVELYGRRVVGWNLVDFDRLVLRNELAGYYQRQGHADPRASADAWLSTMTWEDVMIPFSTWCGEPSHRGGYRWQKLNGPHRGAADCLAVLDRLADVAGRPAAVLPAQTSGDALTGAEEVAR